MIGKIGIRTCFQFFLLITRFIRKGALFYHGLLQASKVETLGKAATKSDQTLATLPDIGRHPTGLLGPTGSLAAHCKRLQYIGEAAVKASLK